MSLKSWWCWVWGPVRCVVWGAGIAYLPSGWGGGWYRVITPSTTAVGSWKGLRTTKPLGCDQCKREYMSAVRRACRAEMSWADLRNNTSTWGGVTPCSLISTQDGIHCLKGMTWGWGFQWRHVVNRSTSCGCGIYGFPTCGGQAIQICGSAHTRSDFESHKRYQIWRLVASTINDQQ